MSTQDKFMQFFDGNNPLPDIVISPVLEPTDDNPSGIYGQIKDTNITCIPGDCIVYENNKVKEIISKPKLKFVYIANRSY